MQQGDGNGKPLNDMRSFFIVWAGQVFSLLGSAMSRFALTIWAYQVTGQATALTTMAFFAFGPEVFMSPFAGALVDRWNRKFTMALADIATGVSTLAMLVLLLLGNLQIWHVYIAVAFAGFFTSFQWPAYAASITLMVPKTQYARASAMISLAESGTGILAPLLAASLIGIIGVAGIFGLDILTLLLALGALLIARIPQPRQSEEGKKARGSFLKESFFGFKYIFTRPSFLGLQTVFLLGNMLSGIAGILLSPMILAKTGQNATILGATESIGGLGGVLGGLVLSLWGGPKKKTHGVFLGWALSSLFGFFLIGIGGNFFWWAVGSFIGTFISPLINASNQAIWQSKVPPDIQGKVFSIRRLIAQVVAPISMLVAGPLADKVFEPLMINQSLTSPLGRIFGNGPGAGMSFLIALMGLLVALVGFGAYLFPAIRNVEKIIPDHDAQMVIEPEKEPVS
ncbi:MAG: MFS transporter [Caldiserica bacterium]|jgi:MFS family permease|nr:MFS transporter [Caldisericota bacterium]MDH7562819.1 MFS transporter [Caldisericota bacterium]